MSVLQVLDPRFKSFVGIECDVAMRRGTRRHDACEHRANGVPVDLIGCEDCRSFLWLAVFIAGAGVAYGQQDVVINGERRQTGGRDQARREGRADH